MINNSGSETYLSESFEMLGLSTDAVVTCLIFRSEVNAVVDKFYPQKNGEKELIWQVF